MWAALGSGVLPLMLVRWNLLASQGGTVPGQAQSIGGWVLLASIAIGAGVIASARLARGWSLLLAIVAYCLAAFAFLVVYAARIACSFGNCL